MPDASQFTLGLFDNTALGWSISTPTFDPASSDAPADHDDEDTPPASGGTLPPLGQNFYLDADRALARGWPARARHNVEAIRLSKELEASGRAPTAEEQHALLRFVGFGASELAQNCFPLPGATDFREGWEEIGKR